MRKIWQHFLMKQERLKRHLSLSYDNESDLEV